MARIMPGARRPILPDVSEESVDLVRRALAAFEEDMAQGRPGRQVPDLVHPDVEYVAREAPAPFHGHDGLVRGLREFFEVVDFGGFDPGEPTEVGEHVMVEATFSGRGRGSGVPVSGKVWLLFTVRAGRIAALREYDDEPSAREAAGA
jgi:ketosteroid isomerase-like protein